MANKRINNRQNKIFKIGKLFKKYILKKYDKKDQKVPIQKQ